MADQTSIPQEANKNMSGLSAGMKFPRFKKGVSKPSSLSSQDMNLDRAALEALMNPSILITDAVADATGAFVATGKVDISDTNYIITLSLPPGGAGGTGILGDTFSQGFANYFLTTGGVRVAKPPSLCNFLTSRTTYGYDLSYAYPSSPGAALYGQCRQSTYGSNPAQKEVINPQYISGDLVLYIPFSTGVVTEAADTGVPIGTLVGFLDLNIDARQWMQLYDQTAVFS